MSDPLILASTSPRRQQLLRQAGYTFDVIHPPLPEPAMPAAQLAPAAWAEALAYYKARSVADTHPESIVIGADTIVVHGSNMLGKPQDEADARRILSTMFGGRNNVITGLAVIFPNSARRIITHVNTTLNVRPMTSDELEDYLAAGAWRGKAGAYALQEGGDKFVQSIQGSHSNIVGLPLEKLAQILSEIE